MTMKSAALVCVLGALACGGSAARTGSAAPVRDADLIGLTVADARARLALTPGDPFVVDEPPGVPRAIQGTTPAGDQVELYIRRGDVPFSPTLRWPLSAFEDKRVIGVARLAPDGWRVVGDVMVIRRMGAVAPDAGP